MTILYRIFSKINTFFEGVFLGPVLARLLKKERENYDQLLTVTEGYAEICKSLIKENGDLINVCKAQNELIHVLKVEKAHDEAKIVQ